MLAYTVVSNTRTDSQIRLSSEGKENAEELAQVRKAITELPAIKVVRLGIHSQPVTVVRHAGLVGWLTEREILVAGDGRLSVYDIHGSKTEGDGDSSAQRRGCVPEVRPALLL